MDYYIDINIHPDTGIRLNIVLNSLYAQFHKALYDLSATNVGVSFPKYKITLGNILRIHGEKSVLHDLQGMDWIGGMSSSCDVSLIMSIPAGSKFRTVSRKQTTMSQAKLRRLIKRGSMTESDVRQYREKMFSKGLDNPYIELVSGSNGKKHRRYIEFGELLDAPVEGEFDHFGLSKIATVPWF